MDPGTRIKEIAGENEVDLTDQRIDKLRFFVINFLLWNKNINLISRNDEANIWNKHILASLSVLFVRNFVRPATILDLGTGGGFPGIPLAICLPDCKFLLIDSIHKKIVAVNDMLSKLDLKNVETVVGRAETEGKKNTLQRQFDYVVARAVGPANDIVRWGSPFLKLSNNEISKEQYDRSGKKTIIPGSLVLMKGGVLDEEMKTVQTKYRPKSIEIIPLAFRGANAEDVVDKKIVIIQP